MIEYLMIYEDLHNCHRKYSGTAFLAGIVLASYITKLNYMSSCLKNLEILIKILIQSENGSHIITPITIVRSRPYRNQRLIEHLTIPLHNQLMSPANQRQAIHPVKLLNDITTKQIPSSPRAQPPPRDIIGVRPHQIAH
jgi:hypothetical protein